jgi:hypothetical protein
METKDFNHFVVNIRKTSCDVYVGRKKFGPHFGNPFSHLPLPHCIPVGSRDEAIQAFKEWLDGSNHKDVEPERRQWVIDHLNDLKGKTLGCYCAPLPCHAQILACAANNSENPLDPPMRIE